MRRGMLVDDACPLCGRAPETIIHALRDCMSIKPVWIQLGVRWADRRFWTDELHEWLEFNGKKRELSRGLCFPLENYFPFRYLAHMEEQKPGGVQWENSKSQASDGDC